MSLKLYYFPFRGRGEQIRLLLNTLEVPFEDVHVGRDEFMELKRQGPTKLHFGSLPLLEDGELRLVEGPAIMSYIGHMHGAAPGDRQLSARAESINLGAEDLRMQYFKLFGDGEKEKQKSFLAGGWVDRWLPGLDYLLELNDDSGVFVGSKLSFADVAVWDVLDAMLTYVDGASLESSPRVRAFYDAFAARKPVAAYLAARPAE